MAFDAATLMTLTATDKMAGLSFRGIEECLAAQSAQHSFAAFSPSSIAGLSLWLDANAGVVLGGGGSVNQWQDQSTSGNNFFPDGVPGREPVYSAVAINGHPGVTFDGLIPQLLIGVAPGPAFPFSIFVVAKIPVGNSSVNLMIACDGGAPAFYGSDPGVVGDSFLEWYDGAGVTTSSVDTYLNNIPFLAELTHDAIGDPPNLYFNGALLGQSASSGDNLDLTTANLIIGVASSGALTFPFTGAIGEIIIYNSILGAIDRAKVEQYLNSKWGLGF